MQIMKRKLTHVRFEPEVDNGTTYAFEYRTSKLVIGRQNMHRLILMAGEAGCDLESVIRELVAPQSPPDQAYNNKDDLLIDLMKLVNAKVLEISKP
jgi:hypothetical protein